MKLTPILLIPLLFFLGACSNSNKSGETPNEFILKTYIVPSGFEAEVESAIKGLLKSAKDIPRKGNVRAIISGGKLLVAAPSPFHRGIKELMKELSVQKPIKKPMFAFPYGMSLARSAKSWTSQVIWA